MRPTFPRAHAGARLQPHPRSRRRAAPGPVPGRRRRPRHHPTGRRESHEPSGGAMNDLFSETPPANTGDQPALSFREAMEELEGILERIEGEEIDIDRLAEELRRAAQLLDLCRGKIRKAEVEVTQIVQSLEQGPGEVD